MSWPGVQDWTGLRSRLGARVEAIVIAWKAALAPAGFVPLSGGEQRQALSALTERLLDVLAGEPFTPEQAGSIGADLVTIGFTRPAALQATIDVFGTQLTPELSDIELRELQPRLTQALAELSSGFSRGMGERILADQETIRAALLSQRDRAAQALRESEARFRAIFNGSPFGIAVTDMQGRTLTANPTLQAMLGFSEDELRDRGLLSDLLHPSEVEAATYAFGELTSGRSDRYEQEHRFSTRDGGLIWAELAIALVRDAQGQPQFAIVMGQDITTRKQAEAERMQLLREQAARAEAEAAQERLTILAEISEQLASSLDYETTLQQVAQSVVPRLADWCTLHLADQYGQLRTVATSYSSAVRERVVLHLREEYRRSGAVESPIAEVFRTGRSRFVRDIDEEILRSVSHDEQHLQIWNELAPRSAMIVPLAGQRGVLGTLTLIATIDSDRRYDLAALALAEDLARRAALAVENARLYREAQDAIRTAEDAVRAREQFLSVAAHELKTPVTSLRGFAQLTLRALDQDVELDRARLRHALTVVNDQSEKLTRLVAQLLDVSRIQSGRLALELRPVDLARLITGVVTAMQHQSQYHPLHVETPPELPVQLDALRIEQVITNLLDNAIKYSPPGGPIGISVSLLDEARVRIAVSDSGPGIPVEHREHIFERFYQAGDDLSHAAGMGLGLFISREIVELHGGTITAEFPPEGGATFVVSLPV